MTEKQLVPSGETAFPEPETNGSEGLPDPFEANNFVRQAPTIVEAAQDPSSRPATLRYMPEAHHIDSDLMQQSVGEEAETQDLTEGEALVGFVSFLDSIEEHIDGMDVDAEEYTRLLDQWDENKTGGIGRLDEPDPDEDVQAWMHRKVAALRETSYLGGPEFDEATAGIAAYWKAYLAEDPERQICLPRLPTKTSSKSYGFVAEKILGHLSPEELEQLHGRIVSRATDLTAPPEKAKVILLDDWMMSGDQLHQKERDSLIGRAFEDDSPQKYASSLEINLLIGDEKRLAEDSWYQSPDRRVPVKAYFSAPVAKDADELDGNDRYYGRISGLHSSADVHFAQTASKLVTLLKHFHPDATFTGTLRMPPLTNIVRNYRKLDPVLARRLIET